MITPILEDLEKELNFTLYKVDVDEEYELSEHFNIRSIPTLLLIPLKGEPISQTGAFPRAELKKLISKYIV
jgi:thioredoxin-like negative regulator of GroEL